MEAEGFCSLTNQLHIELTEVGKKLLHVSSTTADIINILLLTEQTLLRVPRSSPNSIIEPLHQINNALISKGDMHVNISVAWCICQIIRITSPYVPYNYEQKKEFFELVMMLFEKQSSASDGCLGKMTKVFKVFCKLQLPLMMLDLKPDGYGLIVRLFQHYLNVSDSNTITTAIVSDMEHVMSSVIDKNKELLHALQALVLTSLEKDNQTASPVCWQFGRKVIMICAAERKLDITDTLRDMRIPLYGYSKMAEHICKTASENNLMNVNKTFPYTSETNKLRKDTSQKMKVTGQDGSTSMVQTLRHCQDTSVPPISVAEFNRKRKRYYEKIAEFLVGSRIKVWSAKDEIYHQGVVRSYDSVHNMHKVLLNDGFEVVVDLERKRWMSFENVSTILHSPMREAVPKRVSSPKSGIICVQGYKVKNIYAPILDAIIKKHGDNIFT